MHNVLLFIPGMPGGPEMIIILFLVVLLFGANKLPKLARATGASLGEFQRGRDEVEQELRDMERDLTDTELETEEERERELAQDGYEEDVLGREPELNVESHDE